MYSMVLMAALTTGTDMPDWWGRRGGWGCCGCYGGYAWGGYGWGGYARGWGGGGWGGYGYGGWGRWGGWGYAYSPVVPTYSAPMIASNILYTTPTVVSNTPSIDPASTRSLYYDPASSTSDTTRAAIIVHLPADATLIVDGKRTQSTSGTRRFVSPPLEEDKGYHYIFKAERKRDGQTLTTTRKVEVRAGETRQVYLKFVDREQPVERSPSPTQPGERIGLSKLERTRLPDRP